MKIEDIKHLLKSGDVAGAERATMAELENDKDNVRLLILYGTCRQLQGDEAAFRDAHATIKAAVEVNDVDLDEVTDREWKSFEMLYKRLDQPELLRKGDHPRSPVLMEYVILAVLIVAATIGVWIFFGDEIRGAVQIMQDVSPQSVRPDDCRHLYAGPPRNDNLRYETLYRGPVRDNFEKAGKTWKRD